MAKIRTLVIKSVGLLSDNYSISGMVSRYLSYRRYGLIARRGWGATHPAAQRLGRAGGGCGGGCLVHSTPMPTNICVEPVGPVCFPYRVTRSTPSDGSNTPCHTYTASRHVNQNSFTNNYLLKHYSYAFASLYSAFEATIYSPVSQRRYQKSEKLMTVQVHQLFSEILYLL